MESRQDEGDEKTKKMGYGLSNAKKAHTLEVSKSFFQSSDLCATNI